MHAEGLGGLFVGPPGTVRIDLEQDLGVDNLAGVGLALGNDPLELLALGGCQSDDVPLVPRTPPSLRLPAATELYRLSGLGTDGFIADRTLGSAQVLQVEEAVEDRLDEPVDRRQGRGDEVADDPLGCGTV